MRITLWRLLAWYQLCSGAFGCCLLGYAFLTQQARVTTIETLLLLCLPFALLVVAGGRMIDGQRRAVELSAVVQLLQAIAWTDPRFSWQFVAGPYAILSLGDGGLQGAFGIGSSILAGASAGAERLFALNFAPVAVVGLLLYARGSVDKGPNPAT